MNPRMTLALIIGAVAGLVVYVTEVVTPPVAMLVQDVVIAIVVGGGVFLLALVVKL